MLSFCIFSGFFHLTEKKNADAPVWTLVRGRLSKAAIRGRSLNTVIFVLNTPPLLKILALNQGGGI